MFVRRVKFALVSSALFAASVAMAGSALASPEENIAVAVKAYRALAGGDAAQSISLYTQAIESRELPAEQLANALMNRALAHQMAQEHKKAIGDYSAALNVDALTPDLRATALYNRGLAHQKSKNSSGAIEDFTAALMVKPTLSHAFYSRGQVLRDNGQLLFAISDFERALKAEHPDPARVHFALAETYIDLKRADDARRELATVLKLRPEHQEAKALLSRIGVASAAPELIGDPILTASVAPVAGDLPKAVEPPDALLAGNAIDTVAKPKKTAKLFLDRREPDAEEPKIDTAAVVAPEPVEVRVEKKPQIAKVEVKPEPQVAKAEVAPVPVKAKITAAVVKKPEKAKPLVVAEKAATGEEVVGDFVADEITTGSIAPIAKSGVAGWSVQVTSAVSENAAWTSWKKMSKGKDLDQSFKPAVVKADLGAKGIFYRVRASFGNKDDAKAACKMLTANGLACFVSKG